MQIYLLFILVFYPLSHTGKFLHAAKVIYWVTWEGQGGMIQNESRFNCACVRKKENSKKKKISTKLTKHLTNHQNHTAWLQANVSDSIVYIRVNINVSGQHFQTLSLHYYFMQVEAGVNVYCSFLLLTALKKCPLTRSKMGGPWSRGAWVHVLSSPADVNLLFHTATC